jgi:phosphoglycolate phosphatase
MSLAIFWDLDGTLLSTKGKGWPCMLGAAGLQASSFKPSDVSGLTDFQILVRLTDGHPEDLGFLVSKYLECLDQTLTPGSVEPFQEASRALLHFQNQGWINALVTGNHPSGALIKLKAAGYGQKILDLPLFGSEAYSIDRKSIAARAKSRLGASRVVFVGDSPNDAEAALSHGALCIGVATGHHSEDELREAGASIVLGSRYSWLHLVDAIQSLITES